LINARRLLVGAVLAAALTAIGCSHRVIASPGEHSVKLYHDEATYEKIKEVKNQGGPMAMLGALGEGFVTKELDNHTPVRIISQDSEGAQVEVTDGPLKGAQGFVAKNNVS
jgi:transcription antitermination factor NusG